MCGCEEICLRVKRCVKEVDGWVMDDVDEEERAGTSCGVGGVSGERGTP